MILRIKWAPYSKVKEAAEELKGLIRAKYPEAEFRLARNPWEQRSWILWAHVDVEDSDEVRRLVVDREVDMLAEEHIPLHVFVRKPIKAPEKAKSVRARKAS
jgi:hypothetical protein